MTETTPTTYVIPVPHLGKLRAHFRIDRNALIGFISDIEVTFLEADRSEDCRISHELDGDTFRLRDYMIGATRAGDVVTPLHQRSDQELLKLWNEDSYKRLVALQLAGWVVGGHRGMEPVPSGRVEARLAQRARDTLTIEGREDGELIEIGRDALIQRLVALRIDMAIRPITDMQTDTHAGYAEILRGGFKGFEHSGADELLETWRADRKEFYNRIFEGLPLRIHESDPEWEDLINFDMGDETGVDTTSTPLY